MMKAFEMFKGFVIHKVREWISGKRGIPLTETSVAPEFCLKDDSGIEHCLSEYRGKKVVLFFFPRASTPG